MNDEIEQAISLHFENDHFDISGEEAEKLIEEHKIMVVDLTENREMLSYMLIALQGVPDHDFMGKPNGKYVGGMENDIKALKEQGNGGGGFSVRARDKFTIAGLSAIAIIIAEVIRQIRWS